MILWDVNLWIYAFRKDSPLHAESREEIETGMALGEGFLFTPHVAASFLRLVTNPTIFVHPSGPAEAWEFIDYLESHPNAKFGDIDGMTFGIFKHICLVHRMAGNEVPDALLAAVAIRYDAQFVTADSGFKRFKSLRLKLL